MEPAIERSTHPHDLQLCPLKDLQSGHRLPQTSLHRPQKPKQPFRSYWTPIITIMLFPVWPQSGRRASSPVPRPVCGNPFTPELRQLRLGQDEPAVQVQCRCDSQHQSRQLAQCLSFAESMTIQCEDAMPWSEDEEEDEAMGIVQLQPRTPLPGTIDTSAEGVTSEYEIRVSSTIAHHMYKACTSETVARTEWRSFKHGTHTKEPDLMLHTSASIPGHLQRPFCASEVAYGNEDATGLAFEAVLWTQRTAHAGPKTPSVIHLNFVGVQIVTNLQLDTIMAMDEDEDRANALTDWIKDKGIHSFDAYDEGYTMVSRSWTWTMHNQHHPLHCLRPHHCHRHRQPQ